MSPMRCQNVPPSSAIFAAAVASGFWKYSRVTAGERTITSPISPTSAVSTSTIVATGRRGRRMTATSTPANGRPTQVP